MSVGVLEIDGLGDSMVLKLDGDPLDGKHFTGERKVRGSRPKRNVPHRQHTPSGRRLRRIRAHREQREGRRADPDDGRVIAPRLLVAALESKDLVIPRNRARDVSHSDGDVVDPFQLKHDYHYHTSTMMSPRRHMSMLRSYTPADALTIGNAACGTIAIFLCLDYIAADNRRFLWAAFLLLPLALVLDVLDGYVARLNRKRQSLLGADLDSLADVISFGVAPAVLGFTLGLRGGWDMLVLTYFVICGVSRLARFNVTAAALSDSETGKVKYFEGTPIPTSIFIVALLGAAALTGRVDEQVWFGVYQIGPATLHPLTLIYGASGSAMISATLRIPKL
jgi:CDP-diacylglycerol--serine O-phosphatidyltransferase